MNQQELEDRLIQFAVRCSKLCRDLPVREYFDAKHVAGQLIRASTSPAFHYPEARAAESDRDFLHKLKVVLKELRESLAELTYIKHMGYFEPYKVDPLLKEADELVRIFVATTNTIKRRMKK